MSRILIHVEGQTEESFVNEVLAPHLWAINPRSLVSARLMGRARGRNRRGGVRGWDAVEGDLIRHLQGDQGCMITTLVDYYAMPQSGNGAWPGRPQAGPLTFDRKAPHVEAEMRAAIASATGGNFNTQRFEPFVLMHEFEALLFSDCAAFSRGIGQPHLEPSFQAIRNAFSSPEEINDSPQTAPSKRILQLVPGYEKPLYGNLAILEIGLDTIRTQCPHFDGWLTRLENWVAPS